jgi:integrase
LKVKSPKEGAWKEAAQGNQPKVKQKSGRVFSSWAPARGYGFTDLDGTQPHWGKHARKKYGKYKICDERFCSAGFPVFGKQWTEACEKAGLPDLLFHDRRRSGVRQLIRSGVDEHTAMAISGHKTRSIFARYNIVSLDDLRAATKKLDAHLAVPEQQAAAPAQELIN